MFYGMGMVMMPGILQLVNLCVIGFSLALQGSTGLNVSPSPEPLSVNPPIETAPAPLPRSKSFTSNVSIPALQPNGSDFHPAPAVPPLMPASVPPNINGQVPSLLPSTPDVLPPDNAAAPPQSVEGHVMPMPPNNAPPTPNIEGRVPSRQPNNAPSPLSFQGHVPPMPPNNAPPPPSIEGKVPSVQPNNAPPPPSVEFHAPPIPPNNAPPPPSVEVHVPLIPPNNAPPPSMQPNNSPPPPNNVEGHVPPRPPNNAPPPPSVEVHVPPIPPNNVPPPPSVEVHVPSMPPDEAPPPPSVEGHAPSMPPTTPRTKAPVNKSPILVPVAPVPVATPSRNLPQISPNNAPPPPPSVEGDVPSMPQNNAPPPPSIEGKVPSMQPNNAPPPPSVEVHVPPIPPNNAPPPPSVEVHVPSMPPNDAPPRPSVEGHVPSMPPTTPRTKAPVNKSPISVPVTPVPVATPSRNLPQISPNNAPPPLSVEGHVPSMPPNNAPPPPSIEGKVPSVQPNNVPPPPSVEVHVPPIPPNNAPPPPSVEVHVPSMPPNDAPPPPSVEGHVPSMPPTTPQTKAPVNKSPISVPVTPVPVATPSRNLPQISPNNAPPPLSVEGHVPLMPPNNAPPPPSIEGKVPSVQPNNVPPPPSVQVHVPRIPLNNAPPPPRVKGHVPSMPPNDAPPPRSVEGHVPSMPPTTPQKKAPVNKSPISVPVTPVPVTTPSGNLPQISPNNAPPPLSVEGHAPPMPPTPIPPNNASPPPSVEVHVPSMPPNDAPPPPSVEGHVPSMPPTAPQTKAPVNKSPISVPVAPVPVATPSRNLPQISPAIHSSTPGTSPLTAHQRHVPDNKVPIPEPIAPAPVSSLPRTLGPNPPVFHPIAPNIAPPILPVPVASPTNKFPQNSPSIHPVTPAESPSTLPDPEVPPVSSAPPSINWKRGRMSVVAPPHEAPKPSLPMGHTPAKAPAVHKPVRHSKLAPAPSYSSPEPPFDKGHRSPASSLLNPASSVPPSHLPVIPSVSNVSPAPSPSLKDTPHYTEMRPKISPSGSLVISPKVPPLPLVQAFPPPPPNADCSSTICTDPYTNTPPGSPCGCVLPMQVGLRLSVALYTFFPLVSELAQEIAAGVFMQQSQVRIMGANAAAQQAEKTVALIDLVPLGEKFDNTAAFLTSQRFWHKQVVIKASFFGNYDVLYVRYPGLPPSPPSSDADVIGVGPYPGRIKPLGVDVHKGRSKNGLSGGIIAIIALSIFVALALCSAVAWFFLCKPRDHDSQSATAPRDLLPSVGKPSGTAGSTMESRHSSLSLSSAGTANTFSANDIERATDKFDPSRILGEGGFGLVYRGDLEDGTKIAVKVLKRDDQQGGREFLAEVEMLSRLHHRNLVKLVGICTEEHSRCLVYELIPNGSVESHLHGIDKESAPLNWAHRMKIALGAARGLAYLHEDSSPRVIHRDFKASNILLEDDFTPKVSDFGLARTAMDEENRHISTRVMGTFGYVAPEYAMTGHLLVKSDVYSYGVVLLELLTGRKPVDMSQPPGEENLVAWARPLLTSKEGLEAMIDPNLGSEVPFDSIAKVAAIASMCVQPEVSHRPFMGEVVQALKLVCNEFEEAKEIGSRSSSRDDLSIDVAAEVSTASGQLPDTFQSQYSILTYDSELETERDASLLKMFSTSMSARRQDSESFRRHSSSGPLGTGRSKQFWQKLRSSGGSVSEHGFMLKLWQGSH